MEAGKGQGVGAGGGWRGKNEASALRGRRLDRPPTHVKPNRVLSK